LLDAAEAAAANRGETSPDRSMELVQAFAYPLPLTVISEMVGVPRKDQELIRRWSETLLTPRGRTLSDAQRNNLRAFSDYLRELAEQRRVVPTEDLTTFLVNAEKEGDRLDDTELLAMVFLIYVAGHITTANLIGSGVVALLTHPEELAKVRAEPSLTHNLVEETLRYWGPAEQSFPRIALEDVEIDGVPIAQYDRVMVSLAAADRDPDRFVDPERFDITRSEANRHIAFGNGIHVCLGARLARAEAQIAYATLLGRCPKLRLALPADELTWKESFLRGFREVPVLF
jgi:cytochrome P450